MQLNLSSIKHKYESPSINTDLSIQECVINHAEFPSDIFRHIFSYLSHTNPCIHYVSKNLRQKLVFIEIKKLELLKDFIHKGTLSYQVCDVKIDNLDLLGKIIVRKSVSQIKQGIIQELKTLKDEDLLLLKNKLQPLIRCTFIENIFTLSQAYNRLDLILKMTPFTPYEKHLYDSKLKSNYKELLEHHEIDKAIEIFHKIKTPNEIPNL